MKVLVADQFEQSGIAGLADAGCDVIYDPELKDETLAASLRETRAQVLIVRGTKVTADMPGGGVLAHVFEQISDAGINVQETENIVFAGAEAAVARINLDHAPTADLVAAIAGGNENVLSTQLVAL